MTGLVTAHQDKHDDDASSVSMDMDEEEDLTLLDVPDLPKSTEQFGNKLRSHTNLVMLIIL